MTNTVTQLVPAYTFLIALFLPVYVVRWSYFGMLPTTLLELLVWILLVFWVVWRVATRNFSVPRSNFDLPIYILLAASLISVWVTPDRMAALGIARAYLWEPILVFYALVEFGRLDIGPKIHKAIAAGLLGASVWLSILGFMQYVFGSGIVTDHQFDRAHAVFNNGNALALFLGPVLVMLIGWLISKKREDILTLPNLTHAKTLLIGIGIFLLLVFGFTRSLGGMLALSVMVVAVVVSKYIPPHRIFYGIVTGTFFLSLAFLALAPRFAPEVDNPWVRPGGTGQVRLCLWEGTANLLNDHWLIGTGLSGFKEVYSANYVTCDAEPVEYPHNFFMSVWVELGVLGVFGFLMLFKKLGQLMMVSNGVTFVWLGIGYWLLHGLVDVPYFKNDLAMMFWLLLVMVEITPRTQMTPRD